MITQMLFVFYDDFTQFTDAFPQGSHTADQCAKALRDFEGPERTVKCIYTDGAPEFEKMCAKARPEGICHPTSTPYVSSSNARAERRNRHVLGGTRAVLKRAGLSSSPPDGGASTV